MTHIEVEEHRSYRHRGPKIETDVRTVFIAFTLL